MKKLIMAMLIAVSMVPTIPKEKRKEAMEKLITDITAVLTSDQQVLYKQLQEEAAAERRKHAPKN